MTGKCLRHMRKRAGVPMFSVAMQVGMSQGRLYEIERKDLELRISTEAMHRLANLLGVPFEKLP